MPVKQYIRTGQPGVAGLICVALAFGPNFTLAQRGITSPMNGLLGSVGILLTMVLAGCGTAHLFDAFPVDESATATDAPWPLLVDTPRAPAKGEFGAGVPDPAIGVAATAQLGIAARDAAERAEALSQPVLTDAERERLTRKRR
jgi:hypothetical protein